MRKLKKALLDFKVLYTMLAVVLILGVGSVYVTNRSLNSEVRSVKSIQSQDNKTNIASIEEGRCIGITSTENLQDQIIKNREMVLTLEDVKKEFPEVFVGVRFPSNIESPDTLRSKFDSLNKIRNTTLHCKNGHYDANVNGVINDAS